MRALVQPPTDNPAALTIAANTLENFGTSLVEGHRDDPAAAAAAILLWELAAVGRDCVAVNNIALVLQLSNNPNNLSRASDWKRRAVACAGTHDGR